MVERSSAIGERQQNTKITHNPSPLFRLRKLRKKIIGNISEMNVMSGSNTLFFYQI